MSTTQNKTTQPVTAPPSLLGTASAGKPPQFPPQTGAFQTAVKKDVLETKAKEEEELRAAQDKKIASPFSQVMLTQPGAPKPGALDQRAAPQTTSGLGLPVQKSATGVLPSSTQPTQNQ